MKFSRHKHNMFFSVSNNNNNRPACCFLRWSACLLRGSNRCLLAAACMAAGRSCLPDCLLGPWLLACLANRRPGQPLRGCVAAKHCLLARSCLLAQPLAAWARAACLPLLLAARHALLLLGWWLCCLGRWVPGCLLAGGRRGGICLLASCLLLCSKQHQTAVAPPPVRP
jgi:hypothetical protein